jgi:hypothetical protein
MNDAQRKIDRIESLARETGDWRLAFNQLRALLAQSTPPREPDSARLEVWQVRALDAATTMLSIIVNEHPGIFDATHVFTTPPHPIAPPLDWPSVADAAEGR